MAADLDREEDLIWSSIEAISPIERTIHGELVSRNIEFLIEILTAEHLSRGRALPAGCPLALPDAIARKRDLDSSVFPCTFDEVSYPPSDQTGCRCDDPLIGSQDSLDAVAAVILGSTEYSGSRRYFDIEWRSVVAGLRSRVGSWEMIASLTLDELQEALDRSTDRSGVASQRTERLKAALDYIGNHRYTSGVSMNDLPRVEYERLAKFLRECPGIVEPDAWWLVLTAFDKPVWPSDPSIDALLGDLGLLEPEDIAGNPARLESMESLLTDRLIATFHRALAAHALKAAPTWCDDDCEIRKFSLRYRSACQKEPVTGPTVVDLFSGAGGLSNGFARAGAQISLAIDSDRSATDTYRLNHPEIPHERIQCRDINLVLEGQSLPQQLEDVDILIGGPPCQSLSQAGYRARLASDEGYSILDDPRTGLYQTYVEVVERLSPSILLMENVEGIINEIGDSEIRVLDQIEEALVERGYSCESRLLDCSQFGIPQKRERVFLIGVKGEFTASNNGIDLLFENLCSRAPVRDYSLRQGLAGVPRLRRGEGGNAVPYRGSGRTGRYLTRNGIRGETRITFNHKAREHPKPKDRELFDSVMEPGDTGWSVKYEKGRGDLVEYDVGTAENPRFMDKYRMLDWNEPAPTVVAHLAKDANNFIIPDYYRYAVPDEDRRNPERNRGVTQREAARLQSFPDDYIFLGSYTDQFRQIGNAVPPALGYQLAKVLIDAVETMRSETDTEQTGMVSVGKNTSD